MLNELQHLRPLNAGDRNRTGTVSSYNKDFKSCASASSATPAYDNGQIWIRTTEASCDEFTVCPLLATQRNLPILVAQNVLTGD